MLVWSAATDRQHLGKLIPCPRREVPARAPCDVRRPTCPNLFLQTQIEVSAQNQNGVPRPSSSMGHGLRGRAPALYVAAPDASHHFTVSVCLSRRMPGRGRSRSLHLFLCTVCPTARLALFSPRMFWTSLPLRLSFIVTMRLLLDFLYISYSQVTVHSHYTELYEYVSTYTRHSQTTDMSAHTARGGGGGGCRYLPLYLTNTNAAHDTECLS